MSDDPLLIDPDDPPRVLPVGAGIRLILTVLLPFLLVVASVTVLFNAAPESPYNGFDLKMAQVDIGEIEQAIPLGQLRPLDEPAPIPCEEAAGIGKRFLVSSDRVVALTIGGESRAYPLRVLVFHEVVNDVLGGVPIAVVHHPVSDLVAVFDRRFGDETLRFGASGLVLDSHLLVFDRPPGKGLSRLAESSLWSPMFGRAISGPRAGEELRLLPCEVTTWADFRTRFPEGTIPTPPGAYLKEYKKDPYTNYVGTGLPRFRVDPLPDDSERPLFTPMLIVTAGAMTAAFAIPELIAESEGPTIERTLGEVELEFRIVDRERSVVTVSPTDPGDSISVRQAYWFTWFAVSSGWDWLGAPR